jgi:major membrane immunogen (membrane-anchored lipoprotein)
MKKYASAMPVVLLANLILLGACKSTKVNHGSIHNLAQTTVEVNVCDQTVKYYSEKIKLNKTGEEVAAQSEITVNPVEKTISITTRMASQVDGKSVITVIESSDCSLNSDLTDGQSVYKGYMKPLDGPTSKMYLSIKAKDGGVILSNADSDKQSEFDIIVSKWEVVK